jgi:hypothetical protein
VTDTATEIERVQPVIPADDYSDDDMRLLTDEERAALLADDDEDTEEGAVEDAGDEGEDEPAAQAAAEDEPANEPEPVAEARPPAEIPDTAGLSDRLAALEADRDKLIEQFEDGDLTRDEYKAKLAEITGQEREAVKALAKAEAQEEAIREAFYGEVRAYARAYPELLDPNGPHLDHFDRHVRAVTDSAAYAHLSYRQMLEAAHALYAAEAKVLGNEAVPMKGAEPLKAEAPKPAEKPKAKRPEVPPTLAKVPAAAPVQVSEGRFESLQQQMNSAITAEELERIMNSLSPEEAEAFASADL